MKILIMRIIFLALIFSAYWVLNNNIYIMGAETKEESLFKKAVKYFYQNKFEMAELLLQEEVKKNPENELAYSYLGDIFLIKKRFDGALQLYRKSLDINPESAENYFRVGQIYYYKKHGDHAIENYEKSYKLNPNLKFAHFHIGLSYLMLLRDKDNAIKSWEFYLGLAPDDPQYEKIRRAVELLKDPSFKIPSIDSEISIEETLHLGGVVLKDVERKASEKKAGHEAKKTKQKLEDIYKDDPL